MSRTVFCRKYQREMDGLEQPPFPGPKGVEIYENVSQQAWQEWMAHQTTLINEKRLNMMDKAARDYLSGQREQFLAGGSVDVAEGYVPPEASS